MKKPKFAFKASVEIFRDAGAFELADKTNHRTLGIWALECTERVMPYFEDVYPNDPARVMLLRPCKNGLIQVRSA